MADGTGPPGGEELAQLQEELEAARADIERLERDAANAAARAAADTEALRERLRASEEAAGAASDDASALRAQLVDATAHHESAVTRYRDLIVQSDPALPAGLIGGDSIDAVDASVAAAREMVGRVRAHIDEQARTSHAPAGAPPRAAPDLGAMTPEQKIRYGLAQRSG